MCYKEQRVTYLNFSQLKDKLLRWKRVKRVETKVGFTLARHYIVRRSVSAIRQLICCSSLRCAH